MRCLITKINLKYFLKKLCSNNIWKVYLEKKKKDIIIKEN